MIDLPQKIAFLTGCLILLFTPLSFGAVHPWSLAIFKSLVLITFFISVWMIISGEIAQPVKRNINKFLMLFAGLSLMQLIPLPTFIIKLVSPSRWALLFGHFAEMGISIPKFHALSLNPFAGKALLSNYLFYMALYFSFLVIFSDRKHIKSISKLIIGIGFLMAFIAIAQKFSDAQAIYWSLLKRPKFYGTFVNPNHCAVFISSISVFTLVYFLRESNRTFKIAYGFLFAIMAISVFYSLSRGGILAFFTSCSILLFLYLKNLSNKSSIKSKALPVAFLALLIIIFIAWWGTFKFFGELGTLKDISPDNYRLGLWKNTLEIFGHYPVMGTGLGTFPDTIPAYRTFTGNVIIEFAENDYLQLLAETGILGFATLFLIFFQIKKRTFKILFRNIEEIPRSQLGSIFGLFCIALSSIVSFNFYIPGIMVLAILFLALMFIPSRRYG